MSDIQSKNEVSSNGREQTDKSLSVERAKTDASLFLERHQTECHADESVSLDRQKADKARVRSRLLADDLSAAGRAVGRGSHPAESLETDKRLRQERQTADEALYRERRHVDSVLESERWRKKAVERKLFQIEREETDENLNSERSHTDAAAQRAAAAVTTRDEFLAIVSHDLRNPIGSISIAADLLKESPIYAAAEDEERQYLDLIGRNAGEALRLISDLLDIERIAAGKLSLELKEEDASEIVQHSINSLEPFAASKKLSLKSSFPNLPTSILCDRDRISQVLGNLIGNAIKFTPSEGIISLTIQPGQGEVLISITDTGPGIPESMRKIVFERFSQIGKHNRLGLGLGLYISRMIVEAHQGRIWIASDPGQGCTFHFTLPSATFPV